VTYLRNELHIDLADVENGSIELGWTNR